MRWTTRSELPTIASLSAAVHQMGEERIDLSKTERRTAPGTVPLDASSSPLHLQLGKDFLLQLDDIGGKHPDSLR